MRDNPKSVPGSDATRDDVPGAGRLSGTLPASADDQLHTTRQLLIYTLRYSRIFPAETTDDWVDGLCGLDAGAPEAGRAILSELREGYEWAKRQAIKKFFLVEATLVEVASCKGFYYAESRFLLSILRNLLSFKRAIGIMPHEPVRNALAEGKMVKVTDGITDFPVYNGHRIDKPFVMNMVWPEQANVIR